MNFDFIEGLTEEQTLELYDDIAEREQLSLQSCGIPGRNDTSTWAKVYVKCVCQNGTTRYGYACNVSTYYNCYAGVVTTWDSCTPGYENYLSGGCIGSSTQYTYIIECTP